MPIGRWKTVNALIRPALRTRSGSETFVAVRGRHRELGPSTTSLAIFGICLLIIYGLGAFGGKHSRATV